MANIQECNIRAMHELKDQKHFQHAIASSPVRNLLFRRFGFDVWSLPVCGRCEGYAFWDKEGVGTCPGCGHTTKEPITVEQYYEQGHHTDKTGLGRDQPMLVDRELVKPKQIATVYGGEAGFPDEHKKMVVVRR